MKGYTVSYDTTSHISVLCQMTGSAWPSELLDIAIIITTYFYSLKRSQKSFLSHHIIFCRGSSVLPLERRNQLGGPISS